MTTLGVAVVTHNGMQWIDECLRSILEQTRPPDRVVVVDDASTDGTVDHLRRTYSTAIEILPAPATAPSRSVQERIAKNFSYAVRACETDLVALSDQDDRWLPTRLDLQLGAIGNAAMIANDGFLIDESGQRLPGHLRQVFPVPENFSSVGSAVQFHIALHSSLATGGASMVQPSRFASMNVPAGWLHDRWWSLAAAAMGAMLVDPTCLIEYRVSGGQVIGLDTGLQAGSPFQRISGALRRTSSMARLRALHELRSWDGVTPEVAALLRWPQLIAAVMTKPSVGGV